MVGAGQVRGPLLAQAAGRGLALPLRSHSDSQVDWFFDCSPIFSLSHPRGRQLIFEQTFNASGLLRHVL